MPHPTKEGPSTITATIHHNINAAISRHADDILKTHIFMKAILSYFTFTPSSNESSQLNYLRQCCTEACARLGTQANEAPITRIAIVGAKHNYKKLTYSADPLYVEMAIDFCEYLGFGVSKNFSLTPLDVSNGPEENFLNPDVKVSADLLIIANILPEQPQRVSEELRLAHPSIAAYLDSLRTWYDAAASTDASVIVATKYTGDEVGEKHLQAFNSQKLAYLNMDMPFHHPLFSDNPVLSISNYEGADVLVHKDLAHKIAPHQNEDLLLEAWSSRKSYTNWINLKPPLP